jgi:hypothetical protein
MKMERYFIKALWPLILLFFVGCRTPEDKTIENGFSGALTDIQLSCESDQRFCDGSIGMVVSEPPRSSGKDFFWCTGVLVASDMVLTSPKCVSHGLSRSVYFKRPDHLGEKEILVKVSEIQQLVSQESEVPRLDFALLRLERSVSGSLRRLDSLKLEEEDSLHMVTAVRETEAVVSAHSYKLKRVGRCSLVRAPFFHPYTVNERSELLSFEGCPQIDGGLGAPLLNEDGSVVATLREHMNFDDTYEEVRKEWSERSVDIDDWVSWTERYKGNFSIVNNLSCMDLEGVSQHRAAPDCEQLKAPIDALKDFPHHGVYLTKEERDDIEEQLTQELIKTTGEETLGLQWSMETSAKQFRRGVVRMLPRCYFPEALEHRWGKSLDTNRMIVFGLMGIDGDLWINKSFQLDFSNRVPIVHLMYLEVRLIEEGLEVYLKDLDKRYEEFQETLAPCS